MCGLRGGTFNEATPFQAWRPKWGPPFQRTTSTFNEATPFQAWRLPNIDILGNAYKPSTKPRPFRRGDDDGAP